MHPRHNPLYWQVYLAEGVHQAGIGLFTLTQLVSIPLIVLALVMLYRRAPHPRTNAGRSSP